MQKNKKAATMGVGMVLAIVLIVAAVVGAGVYFMNKDAALPDKTIIEALETDCNTAPSLTITSTDLINKGTVVTNAGMLGLVNGKVRNSITSSDTFAEGTEVKLILNGTNYITSEGPTVNLKCGPNPVEGELLKLDGSPSVKVYDGVTAVTDAAAGGANNATASANPMTFDIDFTVPSDEGVNGVVFVIEASNTTLVDKMKLSSSDATIADYKSDKPQFHSAESTTNTQIFKSFRATDISDDGTKSRFTLLIEPESGVTIDETAIYITWYVEQAFVDPEGTIAVGIEDSEGTAKHVTAASSDFDFMIT